MPEPSPRERIARLLYEAKRTWLMETYGDDGGYRPTWEEELDTVHAEVCFAQADAMLAAREGARPSVEEVTMLALLQRAEQAEDRVAALEGAARKLIAELSDYTLAAVQDGAGVTNRRVLELRRDELAALLQPAPAAGGA